ncbi:MAG TPA: NAD(P)/FAD-dependent oxidoreductase, partial [Patescibacteria group bacterium]|nr:NAD(P)/FAD-dependent oxidoreductase [Patescibacteria group bacterium]
DALVDEVKNKDNVKMILNSEIKEVIGKDKLEKIKVVDKKGAELELEMDGLFIEIGRVAHTDWIADWVERDENKQIKTDKKCQTKTPGLFAAGDVTDVEFKQITVACGEATIAALAAYQYIQTQGRE